MNNNTPITPRIVADHGLSTEEYARLQAVMGRDPNLVELGVFGKAVGDGKGKGKGKSGK